VPAPEASRENGAKSRGPKTPEGKARSAQNALKHGMRAQKYVVLPEEDGAEFAGLEAALIAELAPTGALQMVLARRIAIAAWRLARADRIEAELFAECRFADGGLGLALIRDGNSTRSFETLLRYRGAAMAEFWRALRTLKALHAERAAQLVDVAAPASAEQRRPALRCGTDHRSEPNEPDRYAGRWFEDLRPEPPKSGRALHEAPAPWTPNEPQPQAQARPRETCRPQIRPVQAAAGPSSFRANLRAGTGARSARVHTE
jgi:hypothetical protein